MTTVAKFAQELLENKTELLQQIAHLERLSDVDAVPMALLRRVVALYLKNEADFLAFLLEGLE